MEVYIGFIIVVALLFDMANGFNDAANSVATIVATRVLTPRQAVLWAAFFNFVAAFGFGTHVARSIGKGLVVPSIIDPHLILATLLAAVIWTVVCTQKGLPISVSHALIGALVGAAVVKGGPGVLQFKPILVIVVFIFLSPLIGMLIGGAMTILTMWLCRNRTPRGADRVFRWLQLVSAAAYSLSHGLNDAQKTMGIIFALLLSVPSMAHLAVQHDGAGGSEIARWIVLSCHAAIALGTYLGGWKVVKTLGHRVTRLNPMGGFCAETGGAVTILAASGLGIPVSTTHTITGAIFGVGFAHGRGRVRWQVGRDILAAWILTLPCSALMAALIEGAMLLIVR
jgi:inorganic phosphate transporter, PiT family